MNSYLLILLKICSTVGETSCSTKDPASSHTTEKDWILYTNSTTGFGSSILNKDKGVNSQQAVSLLPKMCGIPNLTHHPGSLDN